MQRNWYSWMVRVLAPAVLLGGIPLALGGTAPLQASGTQGPAYAWGANNNGQLGNGATTDSLAPVAVKLPAGVTATALAAGASHSLAVGSDGKAYTWGSNFNGQLGDETGNDSSTPVVVQLPSGVTATAVAAGGRHSLALGSDGNVYASGSNNNGQLGDGTTNGSNAPVAVHLPSGVHATSIAAGDHHSLAIGSDGHVYAWGYNSNGQLGNGTTTDSDLPVQVSLAAGVTPTAIAAGDGHSLAIGSNGKLYAWGWNGSGQLGNGSTANNSDLPVQVSLPAAVTPTAVAGEAGSSLALGSNGKVYSWGANDHGQLGNSNPADSNVPVLVDLPVGATAIGAGQSHGLAIGSNGKLYAWGLNDNGQLGVYTGNSDNPTPVVAAIPSGTTPLALGTGPIAYHSLAIPSGSGPTAALVSRFRVAHTGHGVAFRWQVASSTGILGFSLTAGPRNLNRILIPVHAGSQIYHYATSARVPGPYILHVVLRDGGNSAVAGS